MLQLPFRAFRGAFHQSAVWALTASLGIFCVSSCKRGSSAETQRGSGDAPVAGDTKNATWSPLKPQLLQNAGDAVAIVAIPDETPRPGLLLQGGPAKGGARSWLIVCDLPADLKSVPVACRSNGGLITGSAQPLSKLSSGLTVLGFIPAETPALASRAFAQSEGGIHAVRFELAEPLAGQVLTSLQTELETVGNEISAYDEKIQAARDARASQPPRAPGEWRNSMAAMPELQRNRSDADLRRNRLESKVKIPFQAISATEIAAAETPKALEAAGRALENALLVSDTGKVVACRWQGRWETLESIQSELAQKNGKAESAEISIVSQSGSNALITCAIKTMNGMPAGDFSLVAATQSDLETMGGGTLEQRLERFERVPMRGDGNEFRASRSVSYSRQVTTRLWLKVFSGKAAEPLLDEVILLIFSPRSNELVPVWEKPPSPLIKQRPAPADVPADALKESNTIAASGTIRDLVPAGDGAILMVQTDRAPFWAALDLKSGKWMEVPWKATAETLLVSQAGKIHLVDKATGVIETWNLTSGEREGIKLLQVELPITAVAAPLSNPQQPLIIADAKGIRFLDPTDFHPVDIEGDLRDFHKPELVDRSSIWLRASGDGAIYQIHARASNRNGGAMSRTMVVDPSWRNVPYNASGEFVASSGRKLCRWDQVTDQAGTGWSVAIKHNGERFPNQAGFVSIESPEPNGGTKEIVRLHSRRLFAAGLSQGPRVDRQIYLDSRFGVLVAPVGDKLEWARIGLPNTGTVLPEFAFSGETVKIPLPSGSGHRLTAASSAKVEVGNGFASWTAPNEVRSDANAFSLVWTGELGFEVSREFQIPLLQRPRELELVSPDGSNVLTPRLRGQFSGSIRIAAMAGSGEVVILEDGSVWSLSDCQLLFKIKESGPYLGDAERAYARGDGQTLTAYDLRSGQTVGSVPLGKSITEIITGMSSRNPLIAVETVGLKGILLQIPRNLTRPTPVTIPAASLDSELQMRLFVPRMEANASGLILWDKGALITSNSGEVAVRIYPYEEYQGVAGKPDATGRIIVDTGALLNLGFNPPRQIKLSELPGGENTKGSLDESGSYLLLSSVLGDTGFISIREVTKPQVELLKIRYPYGTGGPPRIISTTRTLCVSDGRSTRVYDLDIPKLAGQFGARP